jgi:hypothetical protein
MPMRDSRRQRQQLSTDWDTTLLAREDVIPEDEEEDEEDELELEPEELLDIVLPRCCSGSTVGRCAAAVCSWRRREASPELDMNNGEIGRTANRGLEGWEKMSGEYSETGVILGVSTLKWVEEVGTAMLK